MEPEYEGKGLFIKTMLGLAGTCLALLYGLIKYLSHKNDPKK